MDISILISWTTKYDHVGWSMGCCPYCDQWEAVRVENAIRVVSIWFIPVQRDSIGKAARCDFCERPIGPDPASGEIPRDDWSPSDGLAALARKLDPAAELQLPEGDENARLHSLLASAKEAASINSLDVTFGLTTGAILGAVLCVPLGIYVFENGIIESQLDRIGVIFASVLFGLVGGAVIGSICHALSIRRKAAYTKISKACENYGIDPSKLEQRADVHGGLVRRAVSSVCDAR